MAAALPLNESIDLRLYYISGKKFIEDRMWIHLSEVNNNRTDKVLIIKGLAGFVDYQSKENLGDLQIRSNIGSYAYHVVAEQCIKPNVDDYKEIFIWDYKGSFIMKAAAQEVDMEDFDQTRHSLLWNNKINSNGCCG